MAVDEVVLAPFNHILGTASVNVPAYSNTHDGVFSIERHYLHGIFMGIKWQCVEYARRWLLLRKSCVFRDIRCAADIWTDLTYVERVSDGQQFPLKAYPNGSPTLPKPDSFLIYSRSDEQPVGHIAVICDVGPDYIRIAEQNNKFHYWIGEYARQIPVIYKDGLYYIEDEDAIYGWMEIEDNNQLKPLDELGVDSIHSQYQQPPPEGKIERRTIPRKSDGIKDSWLNKDDPAENFFLEHYGEDLQRGKNSSDTIPYYKINPDFLLNIAAASNELHQMFIEATNRVIHDDELLKRFGIPEIFWTRIRNSWTNDQDLTLTGRFDLAFNDQKIKVFGYNADSAVTLFECAVLQQKWAEAMDLPSTFTSGRWLNDGLVRTWKKMNITTKVHLLIEKNDDQMITALYMQKAMKEANVESKLCVNTDELYWKDGTIVDSDGETIKFVWKLWSWESIFQDYIDVNKKHVIDKNGLTQHPRISDVLLNDQIKVIEPLWKVITSNKALLPVLWQMYPNNLYLLPSEWNLTDEFKRISFVEKANVNLSNHNVTLYDPEGDSVIATTKDSIYQKLFPLKNYDGYYSIINSWIIRGRHGGFCIREDQNLIINNDSPVTPCCNFWKEEK